MKNFMNIKLEDVVNNTFRYAKNIFLKNNDEKICVNNKILFREFKNTYILALSNIMLYLKLCDETELSKEIENVIDKIKKDKG